MEGLQALLQSFSDMVRPFFEFLRWAFPLKIYKLHDGELGVVKTFGKVRSWRKSEVNPGVRVCFAFEEILVVQALGGFIDCAVQTVVTLDKKVVDINSCVIYNIFDVQKALLETEDIELLVEGSCMNYIREYAKTITQDDLTDSEKLTNKLAVSVNRKIRKYGVKIDEFMITTMSPYRASLICDTIKAVADTGVRIINDK